MIWSAVIVLAVLLLIYLFVIMPRMAGKPDYTPLKGWFYAHRGLHDNKGDAPENSIAAFRLAVENGYGMELDVQLTKDRIPVVFHDGTLNRVCGVKGKVKDYTYEELQQFRLCKSQERIPLFADVLKMVDGRVPMIIEMKIHEDPATVCAIADELIREYKGVYCIESFHPLAVRWFYKNRPEVIRGQLSSRMVEKGKAEPLHYVLVHYLMTNVLCRPDFIAYEHLHKNNISRVLTRNLFGALGVTWTIKSQEQLDACWNDFDLFIFEGFRPKQEPK